MKKILFIIICFLSMTGVAFAARQTVYTTPINYGTLGPGVATTTSGLIGYWPLSGNTTIWSSATTGTTTDMSSNAGINGTLTTLNQAVNVAPGHLGQGIKFDGVTANARIFIGGARFNNLQNLTASAWINVSAAGTGGGAIVGTEGNAVNGWKFGTGAQQISFTATYSSVSLTRTTTANTLLFNKWNFVLLTWDGSSTAADVHMYVNGVEPSYVTTTNGSGTRNADTNLSIGNNSTGSTREIVGTVDDVRIYNRILTSAEIQQLYQLGSTTIQGSGRKVTYIK